MSKTNIIVKGVKTAGLTYLRNYKLVQKTAQYVLKFTL